MGTSLAKRMADTKAQRQSDQLRGWEGTGETRARAHGLCDAHCSLRTKSGQRREAWREGGGKEGASETRQTHSTLLPTFPWILGL